MTSSVGFRSLTLNSLMAPNVGEAVRPSKTTIDTRPLTTNRRSVERWWSPQGRTRPGSGPERSADRTRARPPWPPRRACRPRGALAAWAASRRRRLARSSNVSRGLRRTAFRSGHSLPRSRRMMTLQAWRLSLRQIRQTDQRHLEYLPFMPVKKVRAHHRMASLPE